MKIRDQQQEPITDPEQRGFVQAKKPNPVTLPVIYVDKSGCGGFADEIRAAGRESSGN
jgi:hypothetical protein